jgi:hypothetical protein
MSPLGENPQSDPRCTCREKGSLFERILENPPQIPIKRESFHSQFHTHPHNNNSTAQTTSMNTGELTTLTSNSDACFDATSSYCY